MEKNGKDDYVSRPTFVKRNKIFIIEKILI